MKSILTIALFLLLMAGMGVTSALTQEEGAAIVKDVSGQIAAVDKEESSVVIRQLEGEEVTVHVDISTVIDKGNETIDFSGLTAGDYVDAEYTASGDGTNTATYIWVEEN